MLEILAGTLVGLLLTMTCVLYITAPRPRPLHLREKAFMDATSGSPQKLPSIDSRAEVSLSVVVPAFNEARRLPEMLSDAVEVLERRRKGKTRSTGADGGSDFTYEILVVDDGSNDSTSDFALAFGRVNPKVNLRVLRLDPNRGKGGAVTHGILSSRGERILFADADGATRFDDVVSLLASLADIESDGDGVAIGSRAHLVSTAAVVRVCVIYIVII